MNRNILMGLLWLILPAALLAQPSNKPTKAQKREANRQRINKLIMQEEEGALIYQKQNLFAIKLYNDGYAVMFEKGILKTPTRTTLFSIELGEHKHPQEKRVSSGLQSNLFATNSFIYGKQNNLYFTRLGVGQSILIGGKGIRNGVAVSAVGNGGLSVGLLKPYYLTVYDQNLKQEVQIKYNGNNSPTDSLFLDPNFIVKNSGVLKGFNELKIKPGLFAKAGLRFDYGRYNEAITAIEVGINAEYYFSKIPQVILAKERNLFLNLFIALEFGKRK
jgi:hypothetical protein